MKEKKNIFIIISVVVILALLLIGGYFLSKKEDSVETDAIKFKNSYESLNDTIRESDGHKYNNVTISEDNPFIYVSAKEAARIIKEDRGVIYIGANWCPWCRNAVPVLIDAVKNNGVDKIYYVDLTEYRNVWEVVNGELVKTEKEKEGYYDLLNALDEVLGQETYKLKDEDGNSYDTNEKRIYMPMVLAVKGGKIIDTHVGTVDLVDGQDKYSYLNDTQKSELLSIYDSLVKQSLPNGLCKEDACD